MNTPSNHYALLLGLDEAWQVKDVELFLWKNNEKQKSPVERLYLYYVCQGKHMMEVHSALANTPLYFLKGFFDVFS